MKKTLITLLAGVLTISLMAQNGSFNITDFGAKGDGATSNTIFIQAAIDKAAETGGGTIIFPSGRFVTGVIYIKSNVTIKLDLNAVLLGSAKRIDYGPSDASALIVANNQQNIAIIGQGTIDGQAPGLIKDIYRMLNDGTLKDSEWKTMNPWHQIRPEERNRPKLIQFKNCEGVQIKGITIKDGLCWIQDYINCSNIIIDSIKVNSVTFLNNDGIDLVDCKNAVITNCNINAADDGICLKSSDRNSRCENIYIADCKIRSSASALKFGTASRGGFKNIAVKNLTIYDTYRSAIALEVVDGGTMENVDIRNVTATNTGNAVFIKIGHRNKDSVISALRHIYIGNVTVQVPKGKPDKGYETEGPDVFFPHNTFPSAIVGLPGHPVEDVVLENIDIKYEGGANKDSAFVPLEALNKIPENSADYPEFSMFGEMPAWGFYVRHATGIIMKNVTLSYAKNDFRTAMVFDDVNGLNLNGIAIPTSSALPVIMLNNVSNHSLNKLQLNTKDKDAVRVINK